MAEQEEPVRRRVALKVIKLGMDTKNVIARFEAERRTLCEAPHAAGIAASARGDGPSGFSFDATFSAPEIPSSRSSSSIGLPGW